MSVLKFYDSVEKQEYRKAYAFGVVPKIPVLINFIPPFQHPRPKTLGEGISSAYLVNFKTGAQTDVFAALFASGFGLVRPAGQTFELLFYPSVMRLPIPDLDQGAYYLVIVDSRNTWYSEVFTMVDYLGNHVKIEWCHNRDFVYSGGLIRYTEFGSGNGYKNYFYVDTEILKPQYLYDRTIKDRDFKEFPLKQIRKKQRRFEVIVSEGIADFLSLIELHDIVTIRDQYGNVYNVGEFEMGTPNWFSSGNLGESVVSFVDERDVVGVFGSTSSDTCEVAPGGCVESGAVYVAKSYLAPGSIDYLAGFYYDANGVHQSLTAGDLIISGDIASLSVKLYTYNSPGSYTEVSISTYSTIFVENTGEYWYDRGDAFNIIQPAIVGHTPLTAPDTFYGRASNEITQLWLEDEGGAQVYVKDTNNSALNLGEQVDGAGYKYLVLKTLTTKCGTIGEVKFMIPEDYILATNADDDFTFVVSNVDDDTSLVITNSDVDGLIIP